MKIQLGLIASIWMTISATQAQNIDLRGTIKDKSGKAVSGAEITLASRGLKVTSDNQGNFRVQQTATGLGAFQTLRGASSGGGMRWVQGKGIQFHLASPGEIPLRVFSAQGEWISHASATLASGHWQNKPAALAKSAATVDTLKIVKAAFDNKAFPVSSLVDSNLAITLDSAVVKTPFPTTWIPPSDFQQKKSNVPQGQLKEHMYDNPVLSKTGNNGRKVTVYLPPGYDAAKKYPVLYALHGIGGDHKEWISYNTNVDQIFNNLYAAKKIEPMIVVFPNGRARTDDKANGETSGANVTAFNEFWTKDFKDHLIPFIQKTYSTHTDKENRAVLGYSMGGMQALQFGLGNPDYFTFVGALAPAPAGLGLPDVSKMNATTMNSQFKQIFISAGTADGLGFHSSTDTFQKNLDSKGIKRIWVSVQGGGHDGTTWCPGIYNFAQIIFK